MSLPLVHREVLLGVLNVTPPGLRLHRARPAGARAVRRARRRRDRQRPAVRGTAPARLAEPVPGAARPAHRPAQPRPPDRSPRARARPPAPGGPHHRRAVRRHRRLQGGQRRFGHACGDELLVAFAGRLRRCLRGGDTVARFGGDEFAVLVDELSSGRDARTAAGRCSASSPPVHDRRRRDRPVGEHRRRGRRPGGASAAELSAQRRRRQARGQAVGQGADRRVPRRSPGRRPQGARPRGRAARRARARRDRRAVPADRRAADRADRRLGGARPLAHPRRGLLPAAAFIPIAVNLGALGAVDRRVLHEVCRAARALAEHAAGGGAPPVHFNLAISRLREPGLVAEITAVLAETGVSPGRIVSRSARRRPCATRPESRRASPSSRRSASAFALDGFGTRYASLSQLQHFPFDTVKIDRAFTEGLGHDRGAHTLVQAILRLADSLTIAVVAEGIERRSRSTRCSSSAAVRPGVAGRRGAAARAGSRRRAAAHLLSRAARLPARRNQKRPAIVPA